MRVHPAPAYACIDGEEITMSPPGSLGSFVLAGCAKSAAAISYGAHSGKVITGDMPLPGRPS